MKKLFVSTVLILAFGQILFAQNLAKPISPFLNASPIQIQFDSSLHMQLDQIETAICVEFKDFFKEINLNILNGSMFGFAVCLLYKVDTLNLDELEYPGFDIEKDEIDPNCFDFFLGNAKLTTSGLSIEFGFPFGNQFIGHEVKSGSAQTYFQEYYKDDKIVKLKKEDPFSKEIFVPIKQSKFILSSDQFRKNEFIYGYCAFETEPYFIQDMYLEPALLIKRSYKYYFKVLIQ